jgi:hypothetical protein
LKKLALLGAGIGLAAGVLLMTHKSHAADHLDGPTTSANPMADIGDVYAWMTTDGTTVNLAMTVSPADDGTRVFDKSIQYVWHITSHPGATAPAAFGQPGTEVDVICTFTTDTNIQCWVASGSTALDYVTGDPSTNGISSTDGKLEVFAGRRSDPFYFNLGGFKTAVATTEAVEATITTDAAGCPTGIAGDTAAFATAAGQLRGLLTTAPATAISPCAAGQIDCFANFNVKAIVLQIDKTLLLSGTDVLLSVWGSTHAALN